MNTPTEAPPRCPFDLIPPKTLDRLIGTVAVSPFMYDLWVTAHKTPISFENVLLMIELAILAATMVTRHPPNRVTRNPLFWLLAFVASYWGVFMLHVYEPGERIAPVSITLSISVLSSIVAIWARLSLGRNIGFVPAERRIVSTGAYGFVRHPIYTSLFLGLLAVDLAQFSWKNVALDTIWLALWVIKSLVEESFLSASAQYVTYMKKIRWRWIPGLA
jgi:protein-S-isoprenylcysteine O-methyltransferase Ste14